MHLTHCVTLFAAFSLLLAGPIEPFAQERQSSSAPASNSSDTAPHRAWLGVQVQPGALVANLVPDGPGAKSGIKSGDVIISVNGSAITNARELASTIWKMAPDTTVMVGLIRDGRTQTVSVTLGALPQENQSTNGTGRSDGKPATSKSAPGETPTPRNSQEKVAVGGDDQGIASLVKLAAEASSASLHGWIGVESQTITHDIAAEMNLKSTTGALITRAFSNGPAAESGIKRDDVITSVDGMPVNNADQLTSMIRGMAPDTKAKISLLRNGKAETVSVVLRGSGRIDADSNPYAAGEGIFQCGALNAYGNTMRDLSWAQGFMSARNFKTVGTQKNLTGMALGMQMLDLQEYCAQYQSQMFLRSVANLYDALPNLSHAGNGTYIVGAGTFSCRAVVNGFEDETIELAWAQGFMTGENSVKTVRKNLAMPLGAQMAWLRGDCARQPNHRFIDAVRDLYNTLADIQASAQK